MTAQPLLRLREEDQRVGEGCGRSQNADRPPRKPVKRTARPGATWTAERVAQLKSCIKAGLSCSQTAAEIGVTRNAVIGKLNRLGLSRPKEASANAPAPKRSAWRKRSAARVLARQRILLELALSAEPCAAPIAIDDGRGCSLLELAPGRCRWPINEPGAADFCFCGNIQVAGLPYCLGHARLAYKSTAR